VVVGTLRARPGDGWSARAVARAVLTVVALAALLWILWSSRSVILWVAVAAFLAVAINPAVGALVRRAHLPRSGAIAVVYLLGTVALGGLLLVFIPPLIDAGDGLVSAIPGYVERLQNSQWVQDLDREYGALDQLRERATDAVSGVAGPNTAVDAASQVVNGLVALISIAVMCFLFSLYGPGLRRWAEEQFDEDGARGRVRGVLEGVYKVIAGYVVGVFLVALFGATAAAIFMNVAGIPYWPVLALWVALMALIPLVGAALGAVPYIAVAFFQGWPAGVAALVFFAVYQQVENNLLQPNIHKRTVNLNPLWIIIAVLIGTQLLGIVGALVAIPVAGIVQVLVQDWARHRAEDDLTEADARVVPPLPADGPGGPGGA
jgi:predicted PurR-regulated permease PerM